MISYQDFEKVDKSRYKSRGNHKGGRFSGSKKPAYKLTIDFGSEIGIKKSSTQITKNYSKEELLGKLIIGVVNFFPKQIGPFVSETLTLGLSDKNGDVVLLSPTKEVPKGGKMF